MDDFDVGAWAMVDYIYNTSGDKFAADVFPGSHPSYQNEKAMAWGDSPVRAMGFLDHIHRERLFAAVRQRAEHVKHRLVIEKLAAQRKEL